MAKKPDKKAIEQYDHKCKELCNNPPVCQVSPKTASIDELEEALEDFNPLILNILNSGIPLFDDGSFNNLRDHFRYIVPGKVMLCKDHWEVVA